jgi:hypothetical protein
MDNVISCLEVLLLGCFMPNIFLIQNMLFSDIWNLFNLGQFDLINQMITLTVIPLSGAHSMTYRLNGIGNLISITS